MALAGATGAATTSGIHKAIDNSKSLRTKYNDYLEDFREADLSDLKTLL